jgi:hypothetical protein
MIWLCKEAGCGRYMAAAHFFLVHVVVDMHLNVVRDRYRLLPDALHARAFGAAIGVIRRMREGASKAGVELDLAELDLEAVAGIAAKRALSGEGIGVTDVLTAIRLNTAAVPLDEWLGDAPTKH